MNLSNILLILAFFIGCFGIFRAIQSAHLIIISCFFLGIVLALISWWIMSPKKVQSASSVGKPLPSLSVPADSHKDAIPKQPIAKTKDSPEGKIQKQSAKKEADKESEKKSPPNLKELFKNDFNTLLRSSRELDAILNNGEKVRVSAQEYFDFQGKSKFIGFYIPPSGLVSDNTYITCALMSEQYKNIMDTIEKSAEIFGGFLGDSKQSSSDDLVVSGRVYIYHDDFLSLQQLTKLESMYQAKGLSVVFRGNEYLMIRWNNK